MSDFICEYLEKTIDVRSKTTLRRALQKDSDVPSTGEKVRAWKAEPTQSSAKSSITVGAVENTRLASPAPWAATTIPADAKSLTWSSIDRSDRTTVSKPHPSSARAIFSSLAMRLRALSRREINNLRVPGRPFNSRAVRIRDLNQVNRSGVAGRRHVRISRMTGDCGNLRRCVILWAINAELSAHAEQLQEPDLPGARGKQELSVWRKKLPPKKKILNSREVVVEPMKIVVRVRPEQRKDDTETALAGEKLRTKVSKAPWRSAAASSP